MCLFPQDKIDKATLAALAETVSKSGGQLFAVGGSVRDELLGKDNKDFDCEIHGLEEDNVILLLNQSARLSGMKLNEVGKSFRVWKLGQNIDISLPRRDKKVGIGHRGFQITVDPFMGTLEASKRRDFCLNAIMRNLHTGELVDHFNGQQDLKDGIIRMVSPSAFSEDPLRVLRALVFSARFGFTIEENTMTEMLKTDLSDLPAERVFGELEKLLLKSERPSEGLKQGIWPFPELEALRGVPQDPIFHPEGDCHIHSMMVVDEAAKLAANLPHAEALTVMLAALAHDFGKAETTAVIDGHIRAHGHSEAGVPLAEKFLDRLNVHTVDGFDVRGQVLALVEHHLAPPELFRANEKGKVNIKRSLRRLSQKVRLDLLAKVSLADLLGRGVSVAEKDKSRKIVEWFLESAKDLKIEKQGPERILMGRHLMEMGITPGKQMGEILEKVFQMQLDGDIVDLEFAKIKAAQLWLGAGCDNPEDFAVPTEIGG